MQLKPFVLTDLFPMWRPRIAWQTLHAWSQFCGGFDTLHSCWLKKLSHWQFFSCIFGDFGVSKLPNMLQLHHFTASVPRGMRCLDHIPAKRLNEGGPFVFVGRLLLRFWEVVFAYVCYWASFYLILPVHLETPWRSPCFWWNNQYLCSVSILLSSKFWGFRPGSMQSAEIGTGNSKRWKAMNDNADIYNILYIYIYYTQMYTCTQRVRGVVTFGGREW